jgi:hypothetical protein
MASLSDIIQFGLPAQQSKPPCESGLLQNDWSHWAAFSFSTSFVVAGVLHSQRLSASQPVGLPKTVLLQPIEVMTSLIGVYTPLAP